MLIVFSERTKKLATLSCRICAVNYQTPINRLTKEVDVYCQWIDEAESLSKKKKSGSGLGLQNTNNGDDDDDEDVDEDDEEEDVRPSLHNNNGVRLRKGR